MGRRLRCVGKALRRALLVPPIFLSVVLCLWTVSAIVPFSISRCRGGRRPDTHCLTKDVDHRLEVSKRTSEVMIHPALPLKLLEKPEGRDIPPAKPLRDVRSIGYGNDQVTRQEAANYQDQEPSTSPAHIVGTSPSSGNFQRPIFNATEDVAVEEVLKLMGDLRKAASSPDDSSLVASGVGRGRWSQSCEGRKVYLYDLPSKFNADLLAHCDRMIPWQDMCDYFSNSGMGKMIEKEEGVEEEVLLPVGDWYETHQYTLEIYFHARLKEYPCLAATPEDANLFFVPYYGGLDVLRWHFVSNVSNSQRDQLGMDLIGWLKEQPSWRKNDGIDHFVVLGKICWDFRRLRETDRWGNNLLLQPEMQQMTKLLIERQPWHANDVGVPHPTFFHPRTDRDIRTWQGRIDGARRTNLVSFAGLSRPQQTESIRSLLIQQCLARPRSCFFLQCARKACLHPNSTMHLFMHSEFCLQPPGDSPTRRSIFDSLIAGCIPVLFDPYSAYYQYPWHLPADPTLYSIYIPANDVREGKVNVVEILEKISKKTREEMRLRIIYEIMPGLVYAKPGARLKDLEDGFQIALRSLFMRTAGRLASQDNVVVA